MAVELKNSNAPLASALQHLQLPDPLSILLVGEGNLSFTYALVKRLSRSPAFRRATDGDTVGAEASLVEVVTTTYDEAAELGQKYPESAAFRSYFEAKTRIRVRYYGSVNATTLSASLSADVAVRETPFHLIVFNNPHIGFEDLYRQRSLLSHFFASAAELCCNGPVLGVPQQVVVALCDDQAQRWDLLGCAARSRYMCVAAQPLLPGDYPAYINRRHQSDAAFPFRLMVQYTFVQPVPGLHTQLQSLRAEMQLWELERARRHADGGGSAFSCETWLCVAAALLPDSPDCGPITSLVDSHAAVCQSDKHEECADALNYTASTCCVPFPLLHPRVVSRLLRRQLPPRRNAGQDGRADAVFTPYLPSASWTALYQAQRLTEQRNSIASPALKQRSVRTATSAPAAVPPHLDAALLGRALTAKEAKKLERYLSGYGAAMKTKAAQQKQQQREAAADVGQLWVCAVCAPARHFDSERDLHQHAASRHSGATPLAPTLYARVHEQIEASASITDGATPAAVEAAVAAMLLSDGTEGQDGLCRVCGLQFKTIEAYEEHLRYLAPLPGDSEDNLVCNLCTPPRRFTDRRGLVQHRSSKHPSDSQA